MSNPMNTTPKCLYCGTTMKPDRTFMSMLPAGERPHFWYLCGECGSRSPAMRTQEDAKAAALRRYVEPNRVLTLEEASKKLEAIEPIYIEICGFGGGKWFSNGDDIIEAVSSRIKTPDIDEYYGTEWRCWLRRPTDEERQSVAWEGSE